MPLEVKLAFPTTDLLYQEDVQFTLTLSNPGPDALKVADPATLHSTLILKITNVKTGVETTYAVPKGEGRRPPAPEKPLPPKKSMEASLSLQWLAYLSPGEYEVRASYAYNPGAERAESAPVRLKVRPTTPKNLVLDSTQLDVPVGFWVDLGQDEPRIVRTRFDIPGAGTVRSLVRVAKGGLRTAAVPSRPPNGEWMDAHWAAWTDGNELFAAHVDPAAGASTPVKAALPAGDCSVVHPLYTEPASEGRPGGALLLLVTTKGKDGFRLVPYTLAVDRVAAGAPLELPGPAPSWVGSYTRADKKRLALYAQSKAGVVTLSSVPWPAGAPKKLGEFKGEFAGAAFTADVESDLLRGVVLTRLGLAEHAALERTDFELGADETFSPKAVGRINAPLGDHFTEAAPRVSRSGTVAALLKDQKGQWHLYDGTAASLLPDPYRTTPYPLDLAFKGEDDPVLLAGFKDAGFRVVLPNGQPLPAGGH